MANSKISQLPTVGSSLPTDLIPIDRGGTNYALTAQQIATQSGLPSSPQIGDIIRYNVNGDSAWDAVNQAQLFMGIYALNQTSNALAVIGPFNSTSTTPAGSGTTVVPSATLQAGLTLASSASPSVNTVIGFAHPANGSTALIGMSAFYRFSIRLSIGQLTNSRYWFGIGCWTSGGAVGNNSLTILGSAGYAADSPNKSTIGFRYSAGTDTNFQAVAVTAAGAQTTVDTGVAADTGIHLFEVAANANGSSMFYYIDHVLVATISTNLPPASGNGNSWGELFLTGDNKNTSNVVSATFYSMQISLKL